MEKSLWYNIRDSQVIEECILFGFPFPFNNDVMHVLNFKFVFYMENLIFIFNAYNLITTHYSDLYACLTQLKQPLKIEEKICIKIIMKKSSTNSTLYMKNCKIIMKLMYVTTSI